MTSKKGQDKGKAKANTGILRLRPSGFAQDDSERRLPSKKLISIRLSQDVLEALRAKGRGWQGLADETLRKAFVKKAS